MRGGGGGTAIMMPSYTAPDPLLLLLISVSCCLSTLCISRAFAVLIPLASVIVPQRALVGPEVTVCVSMIDLVVLRLPQK